MNIEKDFADKIINRLANNPAVDKEASLPFDAVSLTKTFNAQIKRADEDAIQPQMFIDDAQVFTDAENVLFVKIFDDAAGLFGMGSIGGNFKILSLCRIVDDDARTKSDLLFVAFVKTFLPNVPIDEFTALLSANKFVTAADTTFEFVELDGLDMLSVFVEPEEVIT